MKERTEPCWCKRKANVNSLLLKLGLVSRSTIPLKSKLTVPRSSKLSNIEARVEFQDVRVEYRDPQNSVRDTRSWESRKSESRLSTYFWAVFYLVCLQSLKNSWLLFPQHPCAVRDKSFRERRLALLKRQGKLGENNFYEFWKLTGFIYERTVWSTSSHKFLFL